MSARGHAEQQVADKLQSAFLFAFGDEAPPEASTVADPAKVAMYQSVHIQEMGECIRLLARELDRLRAS